MFCSNCGAKVSDGAKFCANCGAKMGEVATQSSVNNTGSKLVPAKCTNCGGQLTVDANQQAAVCPFCNSAFIVEQAINNYNVQMTGNMNIGNATINVHGLNTVNLIARAKSFETQRNFDMALYYYNQVLDIDINNFEAIEGINRVEKIKKDYVYIRDVETHLFHGKSQVEVRKDSVTVVRKSGEKIVYYINQMKNVKRTFNVVFFDYQGGSNSIGFSQGHAKETLEFILNAQNGIYPDME